MKTNVTLSQKSRRSLCYFIILFFVFLLPAYSQEYSWVKTIEGSFQYFTKLGANSSGNNYIVARFNGIVQLGGNSYNADDGEQLLISHNGEGNLRWVRQMEGFDINDIEAQGSHVYLAGSFRGTAFVETYSMVSTGWIDGFVIRLNELGIVDLSFQGRGSDAQSVNDLATDAEGNIYITGYGENLSIIGTDTMYSDGSQLFLTKITAAGTNEWTRTSTAVRGNLVAFDQKQDKLFLLGQVYIKDTISFSHSSITYTHGGIGSPSDEITGYFAARYDPNGELKVVGEIEQSDFRRGAVGMECDGLGNFYFLMSELYQSYTLRKFNSEIKMLWRITDPDRNVDPFDITVDASGNVYAVGVAYSGSTFAGQEFENDAFEAGFIVKYSHFGKLLWLQGVHSEGDDYATVNGIDADDVGDVYITGLFRGKAIFKGEGTYTSEPAGASNIFVARIRGHSDYQSLTEEYIPEMKVYPSLNGGYFNVETGSTSGGLITVMDLAGRTIVNQSATEAVNTVQMPGFCKGVYIVVFKKDGVATQNARIVVRR